jgi:hypothetical protein
MYFKRLPTDIACTYKPCTGVLWTIHTHEGVMYNVTRILCEEVVCSKVNVLMIRTDWGSLRPATRRVCFMLP